MTAGIIFEDHLIFQEGALVCPFGRKMASSSDSDYAGTLMDLHPIVVVVREVHSPTLDLR